VDGTPAACGSVSALSADEMEQKETSASPEEAPVVGSGGYLDVNRGASPTMLLVSILGIFGIIAMGAAFVVRRAS